MHTFCHYSTSANFTGKYQVQIAKPQALEAKMCYTLYTHKCEACRKMHFILHDWKLEMGESENAVLLGHKI